MYGADKHDEKHSGSGHTVDAGDGIVAQCCTCGTDQPVKFKWAKYNPLFLCCYRVVEHPLFNALIMLCIIINTVVLSMDK